MLSILKKLVYAARKKYYAYKQEGKTMDKLGEMILYVARKCQNDSKFGLTKLNKILFIADFEHYAITGHAISREAYVHRKFGPALNKMLPVLADLQAAGKIRIEEKKFFNNIQKRVIVLGDYTPQLTDEERKRLNSVIRRTQEATGKDLSEWSHTSLPAWRLTEEGEEIPYHTFFLVNQSPSSPQAKAWTKKTLRDLDVTVDK